MKLHRKPSSPIKLSKSLSPEEKIMVASNQMEESPAALLTKKKADFMTDISLYPDSPKLPFLSKYLIVYEAYLG